MPSIANQVDADCHECKNFVQDNGNNPTNSGTGQGSKDHSENNPHSPISNFVTFCAEHSYSSNPSAQLLEQC